MRKLSLNDEGRLAAVIGRLMDLADIMIPASGEARKAFVIDSLNALIDVPILPESTERAIISAIVETIYVLTRGDDAAAV